MAIDENMLDTFLRQPIDAWDLRSSFGARDHIPLFAIHRSRQMDDNGEPWQAENFIAFYQRHVQCAKAVHEMAQVGRISLNAILQGDLARKIGTTTVDQSHKIAEDLVYAAVTSTLRSLLIEREPEEHEVRNFANRYADEISDLIVLVEKTFDVFA